MKTNMRMHHMHRVRPPHGAADSGPSRVPLYYDPGGWIWIPGSGFLGRACTCSNRDCFGLLIRKQPIFNNGLQWGSSFLWSTCSSMMHGKSLLSQMRANLCSMDGTLRRLEHTNALRKLWPMSGQRDDTHTVVKLYTSTLTKGNEITLFIKWTKKWTHTWIYML
jgi:hypothetical protein